MLKVQISRPGGHDRLQVHEFAGLPPPRLDEVTIAVHAAGVNYADCVIRMGLYAATKTAKWPLTPGFEVAGVISAVGSGVSDMLPGERVFAVTELGGYSQTVNVPREQVFRIPPDLQFSQAAGIPVITLSAHHAALELCNLRPGDPVLVHSAAGGVGTALLQITRNLGCRVVGVVGAPHKVPVAKAYGAEEVIDKSSVDPWSTARRIQESGYLAVFDANGPQSFRKSYRLLAPRGRLVAYGSHELLPRQGGKPNLLRVLLGMLLMPRFHPYELSNANKSIMAFNLSMLFSEKKLLSRSMEWIIDAIVRGQILPPPVETIPVERVAEAHARLESGRTTGKLVLTFV